MPPPSTTSHSTTKNQPTKPVINKKKEDNSNKDSIIEELPRSLLTHLTPPTTRPASLALGPSSRSTTRLPLISSMQQLYELRSVEQSVGAGAGMEGRW